MSIDNSVSPQPHVSGRDVRQLIRRVGTVVLIVGAVVLSYGAVGYWIIPSLPPNGGAYGRLPSVYVMGVGMVGALLGLVLRGMWGRAPVKSGSSVSPLIGIALLLAILVIFFFVVSRL
ncbi:MAG: hypothetical protein KatS3mg110_4304 [Pirellulaceae bacterium]|nr:MAG: hypothetical protein KatS3mg110_4304 [Pirellulaceae bacterium]